jgi:hypothetical protein
MANTVIALKKSGTPSAEPSSLANGELAINYADGKLFYKSANGTILAISGSGGGGGGNGTSSNSFSTVNANGTLIVSDSPTNILTIISGNDIAIVGDAVNDKITISVASTLSSNIGTGANSYAATIGTAGNNYLLAVIAGANSAVGTAANNYAASIGAAANSYMISVQNGSNTAVGGGANVYAAAIGTAGNTYLLATLSGANTSVGAGANVYAAAIGTASNNYLLAVIAGANTAVGAGANTYANSIGTAANSFMISVQNGSNTAVGTGANSVGIAAFAAENITRAIAVAAFGNANSKFSSSGGTINGDVNISGNLSITGNTIWTNVSSFIVNDPLIYLAGNNYVSDIVDIGFVANYVNATGANVHTGLFRDAGTKEYYVFEGYDKEPYNNVIDIAANGFSVSVLNATLRTSNIILGGANAINWINAAFSAANAAVTPATLSGANTAIGTGANNYLLATLAGANTAVGTGANNYLLAVIAGANSAVGIGANTVGSAAFAQANAAFSRANSSNAIIYVDTASVSRYLTFTDSVSGTLDRANIGYGLTFTPSSNQMVISHATSGPRLTLTQTGTSVQPAYLIFSRTTATTGTFYGAIQWSTTASDSSNTMTSSIQASGSTIMPSQRQTLTYSAFTDHRFQVGTGSGNTQFANSSVEVLRIDNSGNVGIGTTSPTTKLHVVGDANVSTTLTVAGYNVVATMGAAFDKANTANLYAFFVDSNTIAAFTQANNVAGAVTTANTIAIAAFAKANAANIAAGAAYDYDNVTRIIANAAFDKANTGSSGGGGGSYQGNNGVVNPSGYGDIFRVHSNTLSGNVYISSGNNSLAAGPITIATGYRLQINTGARVAIV